MVPLSGIFGRIHMSDECQVLQEQATQMKDALKNTSPAERSYQKHKRKQQKKKRKE
jgi:hypothetical protein